MKVFTIVVIALLVIALGVGLIVRKCGCIGGTVNVVHWSNGHLMRPGLMKECLLSLTGKVTGLQPENASR